MLDAKTGLELGPKMYNASSHDILKNLGGPSVLLPLRFPPLIFVAVGVHFNCIGGEAPFLAFVRTSRGWKARNSTHGARPSTLEKHWTLMSVR